MLDDDPVCGASYTLVGAWLRTEAFFANPGHGWYSSAWTESVTPSGEVKHSRPLLEFTREFSDETVTENPER